MALKDTLIGRAVQSVKNYVSNAINDDQGWIRQGKFTPVQQIKSNFTKAPTIAIGPAQVPNFFNPQVRQVNSNLLNKASSAIKNQFEIQKKDLSEYFVNPLKEHPVLGPATTNIEKGVNALGRTAQGYGELINTWKLPQEQRQQQLKQLEQKYTYGNAFKETKDVAKGALTAYGLASPKTAINSMLGGAAINTAIQGVKNVANKIPVTTGMGQAAQTGAGTGLSYSGTTRLTNSIVQYLANSIPLLKPLTEQSIQKGAPAVTDTLKEGIKKFFNTAGKNILKAAVIETAVETPVWGTLNQKEQETLLQSFQREAVENLVMNVGMAGVNTITDSKALFPIIKQSINDVIQSKIYSPEGIALQSGKINFGADIQPKTGGVEGVTVKSPIKVQPSSKIQVKPKEKIQIPTQPTLKIPTTETSQPIIPKERGFITTVKQAEQTKIPVKQKVQGTYEPISNKETLSQAQKIVSQNYDTAKSRVYNEPLTAETNLIGQELVRKAQKAGRYDEAIEIIETMAKKGTESGQAVQAFSVWQRLTPEGMLRYAQKEIKNANENAGFLTKVFRKGETKLSKETAQFITEQMTKVQKMADGIEKDKIVQSVMERINKEIPIGASEIFDAYRYQNLLSSPRTQLRNAYQNAYQALINRPLTMASEVTVDWVKSTLKGTERTKYMSDVPAYYKGLWNSRIDANNAFMNIWRGKENFTNLDINQIRNKNLPKSLTVVGRLMEGADKYFQSLIGGGEYARMMKNGATEEQAKIAAKKMAEYSLLRNLPDPKNKNGQGYVLSAIDGATQGVTELGRRIPALRWFIPFIRTPMNAAKQWIEYSPAGILTTAGAKDKSAQVAKALIGTAITGWGASLAMQDRTTWSAPTDSKEKELFYASGKKPYSIRFGDKWIPMTYFGPQALALAIPAAFKQYNEDSRTALTDNQVEKATKAVTSLLGFFSEQTFLQGLGNFVRAISGDTDYTYAGNISGNISQIIPLSSLQRYVSQIVDPVFRKTGGGTMTEQVVNQLKTQIPGLSKTLEPYKLPTGEVSTRNITDYIAPYTMGLEKPEYNQLLEDRQTKLQENAVLNKAKKEIVSGKSKQIGDNIVYTNENDNPAVLDLTKYDKIAKMPTTNKYNSALKESKQYSEAAKIIDNDGLDEEQKETALKRLGVSKEDAEYYSLANDNTNLKTMFVLDSVANKTHEEVLDTLAKQRKQVNGNMVATNTVLDNLVDEGVISKAEATQLKKYKYESGKLTPIKKSSGGKKIKVTLRKVGKIKFKKAKVTQLKTAQKFKKIKFQKYTPLKVKKYT